MSDDDFVNADKFEKIAEGEDFTVFRRTVDLNDPSSIEDVLSQLVKIVRGIDDKEKFLRDNTAYCEPYVIDKIIELTGLRKGSDVANDIIAMADTDMNPHDQLFIQYFVASMYDGLVELLQKVMSKSLTVSYEAFGKFTDYVSVGDDEMFERIDKAKDFMESMRTEENKPKWPDGVAFTTTVN